MAACSERDPETGCLIWTGAFHGDYGAYGSRKRAHRVSYEEHVGPIPAGLIVCHHCDTPACIEPTHLFVGTHGDNNEDRMRKGRHAFNKLTPAEVAAIRSDPRPRAVVAAEYGVERSTIRRICNGYSWRFAA